jgi:cytochrome c553
MRLLTAVCVLSCLAAIGTAQAPAPKTAPATRPVGADPRVRPAPKATGTLAQLMRGIYFPNANLIYDVQQHDPGVPKKKSDSGSSTDTYSSAYTEWEKVENAAVALSAAVDLILMPGRSCQNGKPVPINSADFQKFARDMRAAGGVALQAARTKSQEKVSDATNNIAEACVNCHEVYRDKGPADSPARCTPPPKK